MKRYCSLLDENVIIKNQNSVNVCITHGTDVKCSEGNCLYSSASKIKQLIAGSRPSEFKDYTSKPRRGKNNKTASLTDSDGEQKASMLKSIFGLGDD